MCQVSIDSGYFNVGTNLGLTGARYFIKIIFGIISATDNWLQADELLYLDKLF